MLIGSVLRAQSYSVDWHKIGGGGGTCTNSFYQVTGTIGQSDASSILTGGVYSLTGGYVEAIAPVLESYAAGPGGTISGMSSQIINYGSSGTAVSAVPNAGYYFLGWSDGMTNATRTDLNDTSNLSVTANFAISTSTLTYKGNGNTGGATPVDVLGPYNYNSSVTVLGPGSLELAGSSFTGWNTAANGGGTAYNEGSTFSITSNTTLYAQWTMISKTDVPLMAPWQLAALGMVFLCAGASFKYRC